MGLGGTRGIEGMLRADVGPRDTLKPNMKADNSGSSDNRSIPSCNPKLEEWLQQTGTAPEISLERTVLGTAVDTIHRYIYTLCGTVMMYFYQFYYRLFLGQISR